MTMLDYFSRWNLYDRTTSFCIWRVYSRGLSIMKVYTNRVPFALPYIISNRDGWSATIFQITFELLPLFLSFHLKPSYMQRKLAGMTLPLGMAKFRWQTYFLACLWEAVHRPWISKELLFVHRTRSLSHCSEDQRRALFHEATVENPGHLCLQCWFFCDAHTQGLSPIWSFANLRRPYNHPWGRKRYCRGVPVTNTQPMCDPSPSPASCVSSEMPRGCSLIRDGLPCDWLMLSGPLGVDWYSGSSWRASVLLWCAFSVIKRNDFPKSHILCIDTWALLFNLFFKVYSRHTSLYWL